jgi:Tol biopolymer transport system component
VVVVSLSRVGLRVAAASVAGALSVGATSLSSGSLAAPVDPLGTTTLVSVSSDGVQGNRPSDMAAVSHHGRYVAFTSWASNLVPGDTNGVRDVFIRDLLSGVTRRVSVSSAAAEGNSASGGATGTGPSAASGAAMSTNGQFVAFSSSASNLVPGDTNSVPDVFLRDRVAGTTRRVSLTSREQQGKRGCMPPAISSNGRFVAFATGSRLVRADVNHVRDVYVRDLATGTTHLVSTGTRGTPGDHDSGGWWMGAPAVTAQANSVAFASLATDLVGADHNGFLDVFVRSTTGTTQRVSVSSDERGGNAASWRPAITRHVRFVAFASKAFNLVPGSVDGLTDVFVRDRATPGRTEQISVRDDGSEPDGNSDWPSLSTSGRFVAFESTASNLVADDVQATLNVYVRDRHRAHPTTTLVSADSDGTPSNGASMHPALTGDGQRVAFTSDATNLVAGDANGVRDVFIRHTTDSADQ